MNTTLNTPQQDVPNRPVPEEILKAEAIYWKIAQRTQWGMAGLAIIAFAASLIVTSFDVELKGMFIRGLNVSVWKSLSFVATLSAGLIGLLSLQAKTKDVWAAWRILNVAILSYKYNESYTLSDLLAAYNASETAIGNVSITSR